jgi:hypothetical protein
MADQDGKRISMEKVIFNSKQIDIASAVCFITGGIISGILGLTGLNGLFLLLAVMVILNGSLLLKMGLNLSAYSNQGVVSLAVNGVKSHAMSFVLFWTLSYALVHIY